MKVSTVGRQMIEAFEGCVLHAYPDPATGGEPWTIGYGHTVGVQPGQVITQAQADQMLSIDLDNVYGPGVQAAIAGAPTTQNQFDAMVSLAFNIGVAAFKGSSVCRMHVAGNHQAASESFVLWNHAAGRALDALTRRRMAEAALYMKADTPQDTIKRVQEAIGTASDGQFGPHSLDKLNETLRAAGQRQLEFVRGAADA